MTIVTVQHKFFAYYDRVKDPRDSDKFVQHEVLLRQGQTVDVPTHAFEEGSAVGAFATNGEEAPAGPNVADRGVTNEDFTPEAQGTVSSADVVDEAEAVDLYLLDQEELNDHIREEEPTVDDLMAAFEDPEADADDKVKLAGALKVAEVAAKGSKARKGLLKTLDGIIAAEGSDD